MAAIGQFRRICRNHIAVTLPAIYLLELNLRRQLKVNLIRNPLILQTSRRGISLRIGEKAAPMIDVLTMSINVT